MDRPPFHVSFEDFDFSLESYGDYYFIHNTVRRFTPSVKRELLHIVETLEEIVELRVFCAPDNEKLLRYAASFGFTVADTATSPHDGELKLILMRST